MKKFPLFWRIGILMCASLLVFSGVRAWLHVREHKHESERREKHELLAILRTIAPLVAASAEPENAQLLAPLLNELETAVTSLAVVRRAPAFRNGGGPEGLRNELLDGDAMERLDTIPEHVSRGLQGEEAAFDTPTGIGAVVPLRNAAGEVIAVLEAQAPSNFHPEHLDHGLLGIVLLEWLGVMLCLALLGMFARSVLRLMRDLNAAQEELARGNLDHRLPAIDVREFGEVAGRFNGLWDRIAEERLSNRQRTNELREANEAKDLFLAKMSHEIRTPLNGIRGMVDVMEDLSLTVEQHECLNTIRRSSDLLLTIINEILDLSKLQAGRLELERIPFSLRETVEEVVDLVAVKAQEKGLFIGGMVGPSIPSRVMGDPDRTKQVLLNLVSNAVKFTDQGEVVLSVQPEHITNEQVVLTFQVRDTGVGIPEDKLEAIFEPFTQVDASTTRRYGGTGLGLAICRKLVKAMGGYLQATSKEGQGSVFAFQIALDQVPNFEMTDNSRIRSTSLAGISALVVDGSLTSREIMRDLLLSMVVFCEEAGSGEEALVQIETLRRKNQLPEVAIVHLDVMTKGLSDVLQRLEIPVALTCPLVRQGEAASATWPVAGVINKPVKRKYLHASLADILKRNRAEQHPALEESATHSHVLRNLGHERHILIVDDNKVNQRVAGMLIRKVGMKYDFADNGQQAIEALGEKAYDLVLMDCQMPVLDGYEATRIIRETQGDAHIPIIALTAGALKGDKEKCLAAGMDDYLTKPISKDALYEMLEMHLNLAAS